MSDSAQNKRQKVVPKTSPTKLTEILKLEVCQRLAEYQTPTEIREWLHLEHGIDLAIKNISRYRTADKWADEFQRRQATFNADLLRHAGASKSYRVRKLTRQIEAIYSEWRVLQKSADDIPEARAELRQIYEQLRKEMDAVFSELGKPMAKDEAPIIITEKIAAALGIPIDPEEYER